VFAVQGLFAIVEFVSEESAQKALSHDQDIVLRGRRLVVKPRRVKQEVATPSDNHDKDNCDSADKSPADLHSQLISKLASCGNVCISLLYLLISFYYISLLTFHSSVTEK